MKLQSAARGGSWTSTPWKPSSKVIPSETFGILNAKQCGHVLPRNHVANEEGVYFTDAPTRLSVFTCCVSITVYQKVQT